MQVTTQLSFPFNAAVQRANARAQWGDNRHMETDDDSQQAKARDAKLRNRALRLLTTREHSRQELMRKLAQSKQRYAAKAQTEPPRTDELNRLLDDLASAGWQSDDRYAEAIVRRLSGQASRRYIADKLAQTGIKKEVAALAMEALSSDEMEVARALWTRRYGSPAATDKERQRQIRFLLGRGFHLSDAFKIVPRAVLADEASTDL